MNFYELSCSVSLKSIHFLDLDRKCRDDIIGSPPMDANTFNDVLRNIYLLLVVVCCCILIVHLYGVVFVAYVTQRRDVRGSVKIYAASTTNGLVSDVTRERFLLSLSSKVSNRSGLREVEGTRHGNQTCTVHAHDSRKVRLAPSVMGSSQTDCDVQFNETKV